MDEPEFSRTERYRFPGVEEEPQYGAALDIWKELCRAKGRWTRQSHYFQSSAVLIITCLGERDGLRIPYQMALKPNDIDKLPEDIKAFCPNGPHWVAGGDAESVMLSPTPGSGDDHQLMGWTMKLPVEEENQKEEGE